VRSIAGGLLVAPEFARAAERLGADRPGAWVVRSIDAPTADMRALLEEQFAGRVAFYTYAPHRVMLAAGTPETLEAMAQWRETYAPIDTED
jgi:hypothetical protein